MYNSKRTATVCAATFADLSCLQSADFDEIMEKNPEFAKLIEKNFDQYLKPGQNAVKTTAAVGNAAGWRQRRASASFMDAPAAENGQLPLAPPAPASMLSFGMQERRTSVAAQSDFESQPRRASFLRKLMQADKYGQLPAPSAASSSSMLVGMFCAKLLAAKAKRQAATTADSSTAADTVQPIGSDVVTRIVSLASKGRLQSCSSGDLRGDGAFTEALCLVVIPVSSSIRCSLCLRLGGASPPPEVDEATLEEALESLMLEGHAAQVESLLESQKRQSEQIERLLASLPQTLRTETTSSLP